MAEQWQLRKGSTAENEGFVGAEGELTYDTNTKAVHIHDGETAGGALIDAVVAYQLPTSENGYTWYRKYASGWVEQGGFVNNTTAIKTINLVIPMANTNYQIQCTSSYSTGDGTLYQPHVDSKTTTSFKSASYGERGSATNNNGAAVFWEVKGIAA